MGTSKLTEHINCDRPKSDPKDDYFGYAKFANNISKSTLGINVKDRGIVIGLCGPWGSGKTTLLNFIKYYLKKDCPYAIIVDFNPWWFSEKSSITEHFFKELLANLPGNSFRSLVNLIKSFSNKLSSSDIPYVKTVSSFINKDASIISFKLQITNILNKFSRKIIFFIDDVDRLSSNQIVELFQTIKSIADFPNIIYVTAFDKTVVEKALSKVQDNDGSKYLEKTIQVIFDIPIPETLTLSRLLYKTLDTLLTEKGVIFNKYHWGSINSAVCSFFKTPRDIVRFLNPIFFTFHVISKEVDFVDFIGIEALRIFRNSIYTMIRERKHYFIEEPFQGERGRLEYQHFFDNFLSKLEKDELKDSIISIIVNLFPETRVFIKSNAAISGDLPKKEWRKNNRICNKDVFPVYFKYDISFGLISKSDIYKMFDILNSGGSEEHLGEFFLGLLERKDEEGESVLNQMLQILRSDYAKDDIIINNATTLIKILFKIGDTILEQSRTKLTSNSVNLDFNFFIRFLITDLLFNSHRDDEEQRYAILKDVFESSSALVLIGIMLWHISLSHGKFNSDEKYSEAEQLVTEEHLNGLALIAISRFTIKFNQEPLQLMKYKDSTYVIKVWSMWDKGSLEVFINTLTKTDDGLLSFLDAFRPIVYKNGVLYKTYEPDRIEQYINIDKVHMRLADIESRSNISNDQRELIGLFNKGYELYKRGVKEIRFSNDFTEFNR